MTLHDRVAFDELPGLRHVEQFGGDAGFCVEFAVSETHVHFEVYQTEPEKNGKLLEHWYPCIKGSITPTGEAALEFGSVGPHSALTLKGASEFKRHFALLEFIYRKAGELLASEDYPAWVPHPTARNSSTDRYR